MGSQQKKSEALGMSWGTARARLQKLVLFRVLQDYQDNVCYRCGEAIEIPEHLSIEHKSPWGPKNKELFWDLNNIAFSHLLCNAKAGRQPRGPEPHRRKPVINGKKICAACRIPKDIEDFRKIGRYSYCKDCESRLRKSYKGR